PALRSAERPADRVHSRAAAVLHRHDPRQHLRLLRRLGGHGAHAPGRHRCGVPVLRVAHCPGLRARPCERSIYIAITLVGWVSYARIIRGEILVAKRQDYVVAARSGGLSPIRIIGRHLLPNVITLAIIYAMSDIVQDILAIVTLGYFGLGVPPPTPDLGSMINDGQNFLPTAHWQLTTFPGLAVVVVGLALSLIGDGLADLLRPGHS